MRLLLEISIVALFILFKIRIHYLAIYFKDSLINEYTVLLSLILSYLEFFKEFEEILLSLLVKPDMSDLTLTIFQWFFSSSKKSVEFFQNNSKPKLLGINNKTPYKACIAHLATLRAKKTVWSCLSIWLESPSLSNTSDQLSRNSLKEVFCCIWSRIW